MVKKFKNFISNKKSPSASASKLNGSQQKIYENASQFYVEGNFYENSPKSKSSKGACKSSKKIFSTPEDIYENTEFHEPPAIYVSSDSNKTLSNSEKNLSAHSSNSELKGSNTTLTTATLRQKNKAGKSFKSRLRKSLVGTSVESKTALSTLSPTRSTFYIEDPISHGGSGELDSGFSEKASSSGDLPNGDSTANQETADSQQFATVCRKNKKDPKSVNAQRRRTTIGSIRPHEPPPPPPEDATRTQRSQAATTSWYAECGVFKNGTTTLVQFENSLNGSGKSNSSQNGSVTPNGTSWYADAGLYQTSGDSVASSSGSSGVSTGNEAGLGDEMHSMFLNEPLYQIYSAAKLKVGRRRKKEENRI